MNLRFSNPSARTITGGGRDLELNSFQLEELNRNGYLKVENLAPPGEVAAMRKVIERLFLEKAGLREGNYGELIVSDDDHDHEPDSPQIRMIGDYAPELRKSACFHNALALARQILGPEARFASEIAILKRPSHGTPTPWHQDEAFRDPGFEYREVTVWVALQDVDERSGCLKFIGGSHCGPVHQHSVPGDPGRSLALECTEAIDEAAATACPLLAGSCTIHFPRTLHRSTSNASPNVRIGYAMTFGTTPAPVVAAPDFPWLRDRIPVLQARRRTWMRHGGFVVASWRRVRNGQLTSWKTLRYWARRGVRTIVRGG